MGGGRPHTEPCLCPQAPSPSPSRTCGPPWSGARGGSTRSARHTSPTSSWSAAPAFGGVPGGGQHGVTLGGGCRGVGGIVGWAAWRDIGGGGGECCGVASWGGHRREAGTTLGGIMGWSRDPVGLHGARAQLCWGTLGAMAPAPPNPVPAHRPSVCPSTNRTGPGCAAPTSCCGWCWRWCAVSTQPCPPPQGCKFWG